MRRTLTRTPRRPPRLWRSAVSASWLLTAAAVIAGLTVALGTSGAGLRANSSNAGNSAKSGAVSVTDAAAGSAMFSTLAPKNDGLLVPGQTLSPRCVQVDYAGSWYGDVVSTDFSALETDKFAVSDGDLVKTVSGELNYLPSSNYLTFVTHNNYDFRNKYLQIEVTAPPNPAAADIFQFFFQKDSNNIISATIFQGKLIFQTIINGVAVDPEPSYVEPTYSNAAMRFLRIQSLGQKILWLTSPDGITWTTRRELLSTLDLRSVNIRMLARPSTSVIKLDNMIFSPTAGIRLYGNLSGALQPYLTMKVEVGTGSTGTSCTGFVPSATLFNGTLDTFPTDYAHGLTGWMPSAATQSRSYRFTASISDAAAENLDAAGSFTWETQTG